MIIDLNSKYFYIAEDDMGMLKITFILCLEFISKMFLNFNILYFMPFI